MHTPDVNEEAQREQHARVVARRQSLYSQLAILRCIEVDQAVVLHTGFERALRSMDRAFQLGSALSAPTGLIVYGGPGTGKTTLMHYFAASLPLSEDTPGHRPVISLRLSRVPTLKGAIEAILTAAHYPFPKVTSGQLSRKRAVALDVLKRYRTKVVLVDEAHHLCNANARPKESSPEGSITSDFFREVVDSRVGLVLCGGPALLALKDRDRYLHSRCAAKVELEAFAFGPPWIGLVRALVARSQHHDLTYLSNPGAAKLLHGAVLGNLRWLKLLLIEAILVSVDSGKQAIDQVDLAVGFDRSLGGVVSTHNPWSNR